MKEAVKLEIKVHFLFVVSIAFLGDLAGADRITEHQKMSWASRFPFMAAETLKHKNPNREVMEEALVSSTVWVFIFASI